MLGTPGYVPDILEDDALTIYIDGSQKPSPRRGGIGIRFVWTDEHGKEVCWDASLPATMGATNNQMELEAPSVALELADRGRLPVGLTRFNKLVIRSDSRYVDGNLNNALFRWPRNRWSTAAGMAVLNVDDWKRLVNLIKRFAREHHLPVQFEWIPGKKGRHAKAVDKLAKLSADSPSFGRARPSLVRRKKTTAQVERGSVKVTGQELLIHVISLRYLPQRRRTSRCKYEVLSKGSPYHGAVDEAETEQPLDAGHTYRVRMNTDQANPRVEELLEEVEEDLTAYTTAMRTIGAPATAAQVRAGVTRSSGAEISPAAVKRRLDVLVERGQARRERATTGHRPYLYELIARDATPEQAGGAQVVTTEPNGGLT